MKMGGLRIYLPKFKAATSTDSLRPQFGHLVIYDQVRTYLYVLAMRSTRGIYLCFLYYIHSKRERNKREKTIGIQGRHDKRMMADDRQ